jgi:hypothetical protein
MSLHTAISRTPWPIPQHSWCACWESEVYPGDEAWPFVDFSDHLKSLTNDQKEGALGRSLWRLVVLGVVDWEDVVMADRIRSLAEVVKRNRLTVEDLVDAGIPRATAQRAVNASVAPAAEIIKRHRDELHRRVGVAAAHDAGLRKAVAAGVGGTPLIGAAPLPGGAVTRLPVAPTPALPPGGPQDAEMAERLREYMRQWPDIPLDLLWWILEEETPRRQVVH